MNSILRVVEHGEASTSEVQQDHRALILLHAFPLDARMWAPAAQLVAAKTPNLRVLAINLPGAGSDSSPIVGVPSLDLAADYVAQTLQSQGITQAVIAGVSMGGYVALAIAQRHPELVGALALIDTRAAADTEPVQANRELVAARVEEQHSVESLKTMVTGGLLGASSLASARGLTDLVSAWIAEQDPAYVAWSQRAMAQRPDRTQLLADATFPVEVIVGGEDVLAPVGEAKAMVDAASFRGRLTIVPAAGHLSPLEAPEQVASALQDLVALVW